MEMEFKQTAYKYLRPSLFNTQTVEQTQEIKLTEDMPDVGSVIGAWGQCILRSKQWNGSSASVSGGVMCWVLYKPSEEGDLQKAECWIPFQCRLDLPGSGQEGLLRCSCQLSSMEGRMVSARRIMLRCSVGIITEALERDEVVISSPTAIPDDIQLKLESYPLLLPRESGELQVVLDEDVPFTDDGKLLRCQVQCSVTEQKVSGSRLVVRGMANGRILYLKNDDCMEKMDFEIPFSHVTELDREYGDGSMVSVVPVVTDLDPELQPGMLSVRGGLACQYLVYERIMTEIATDAYSPCRNVEISMSPLAAPMHLDSAILAFTLDGQLEHDAVPFDTELVLEPGVTSNPDAPNKLVVSGGWKTADLDAGQQTIPVAGEMDWQNTDKCVLHCWMQPAGWPVVSGNSVRGKVNLLLTAWAEESPQMITAISCGEIQQRDAKRPSIVIRKKKAEESLWQVAKKNSSTVSAILLANNLQHDIADEMLLLIPTV